MLRCDTPAQGSSPPPPVSWRNGARSPSKHLQGHVDTQLHVLHVVVMLLFNQILLAGTIPKRNRGHSSYKVYCFTDDLLIYKLNIYDASVSRSTFTKDLLFFLGFFLLHTCCGIKYIFAEKSTKNQN